jgi:hypothetical protein
MEKTPWDDVSVSKKNRLVSLPEIRMLSTLYAAQKRPDQEQDGGENHQHGDDFHDGSLGLA